MVSKNAIKASYLEGSWFIGDQTRKKTEMSRPNIYMSDKELCVCLGKEGYRDAFEILYNRHNERLHTISYRHFQNKEEARDVVQDVFLKILEKRHELSERGIESMEAYLVRAVQNMSKSLLRKQQNRRSIIDRISVYFRKSYQLETDMDKNIVMECIKKIPNQQFAEMLRLHAMGYKNEEIAQRLGKEVSWVRKRKPDAKKELDKQLKKYGLNQK